jgi:cytochrome oxidase Cu insertion factor (SCO1/SenC/PrrC family)
MKWALTVTLTIVALAAPAPLYAQKQRTEEDFVKERPRVGDVLPDLTVYDPEGKPVKTSTLRGHYTVLTFGCLT